MINFLRKLFGYCVHDWDKYSNPIKEKWTRIPDARLPWNKYDYYETIQVRYCKKCGECEKRYLE